MIFTIQKMIIFYRFIRIQLLSVYTPLKFYCFQCIGLANWNFLDVFEDRCGPFKESTLEDVMSLYVEILNRNETEVEGSKELEIPQNNNKKDSADDDVLFLDMLRLPKDVVCERWNLLLTRLCPNYEKRIKVSYR